MPNTDVQSSLEGITYPCEKRDIVEHARGKGASMESITKLEGLPERQYEDYDDVISEVGSSDMGSGDEEDMPTEDEVNKM
jgi:hypothetical protein